MENTKTEPHDTQEGYCCACGFDMIELKEREAAAFKRGLERAEEIIRNLKVRAASKDLEGIADIHRHFLDETREILFAALKEAARLPDEGADKK